MPSDALAAARDRARANSYWRHLGVEVLEAGEGAIRLRVAIRDELRNAPGAPLHGGVLSALVDMAVGGALATLAEDGGEGGVMQTTLDLNVSFLAAGTGDEVIAEGRILRRGRTVAFGEARVSDAGGRLLAVGRATYMIIARR